MLSLELSNLVHRLIHLTDQHVFLTGKAGTGKTTLLKELTEQSHKRIAIVAPTGVAAIQAGGVTIHSFFGIHPHTFLPWGEIPNSHNSVVETSYSLSRNLRLAQEKIKIIKSLDLLVIDEISMVRCDLLDSIDLILRKYREIQLPFGGVQLLMIGDLYQLPPVVRDEDATILSQCYPGFYFFESKALQKCGVNNIELMHVYRQTDSTFIELLNQIRHGEISDHTKSILNAKVIQYSNKKDDNETITLTTHVSKADEINLQKLDNLKGRERIFEAKIEGEFSQNAYPTELNLRLKLGAQVMFIKNDKDKRYYNGKIGIVEDYDTETDSIIIRTYDDAEVIYVTKEVWKNVKYAFDDQKNSIQEDQKGQFEQYPLRLAWAITIHKSQGLTFDKVMIDASRAFAPGQVYVAMSRCRTLSGITLLSPINTSDLSSDDQIVKYHSSFSAPSLILENLNQFELNHLYTKTMLAFDLKWLKPAIREAQDGLIPLLKKLDDELSTKIKSWEEFLQKSINIAGNYRPQLEGLFYNLHKQSANNEDIIRVYKAVNYFNNAFIETICNPIEQIQFDFRKEKGIKAAMNSLKPLRLRAKEAIRQFIEVEQLLNAYVSRPQYSSILEKFNSQLSETFSKIKFDLDREIPVKTKPKKVKEKKKVVKGSTQLESLNLLRSGKSILDIAIERGLKPATITNHLCKFIEEGDLEIGSVLPFARIQEISAAIEKHGIDNKLGYLIKEMDEFEFDDVKLVYTFLLKKQGEELSITK